MTWGTEPDGRAYVQCDHEGCAQRVYPKTEHGREDHTEAADIAVARGWHVPQHVDVPDYCAVHRPFSTLRGLR